MLTVQTEILDICPPGNENRPKALSQLAAGRLIRFEKEAVIDDLEESIRLFRESAKSMGKDDDDYPLAINNLANGIHTRYEQLGNAADLHESIQLYREALSYLTKGDYDRAAALNNLANALLSSWKDFAVSDDLQESIRLQRESLVLQPEPQSDRPLYLNNLANCLYEKFKRGGDMAEISDLDESISVFRQALDLVAEEDPERSTYIRNRGLSHHTRFQRFGDSEDAEQARVLFADALALLPPGRSDRARCLFLTANLYLEPSTSFYDPRTALTQLKEALSDDHYNAQLRLNEAVTTLERTTGIAAADIDVDTENGRALRAALLQAHTHTIRLLPRAAYFGLNIRTRLRALRSAERLALECATHALRLGRLEVAVETLEEGRGVFWTQALRLRTPFDDLPPDVRQELVDLSRKLEQDSYEQAVELDPEDTQAKAIAEDNAASRRRQSVLFDAKMDEVRRLPGFERFMLPATFSTLLSASIDGPVAILVASSAACDALILRPSGDAQCVSLKIGIPRLEELGTLLLEANQQLRGAPASASEDRKMKRVITGHQETRMGAVDVLKEIWKTVVKPVIDSLQLQRSTGRTRPRLWWMPTGQFAFLPIHAAGISSAHGGEWCSDYVVSSYTPTLSALLSARRDFRPIPRREAKILLAAVPHPFQGSDLPCTVDEVVHIKDAVPADMLLPLPEADDASLGFRLGTGASLPTMLEMLPKATMLHLACHGWQHPSNPLDSGFILRDAMLTIAELMPLPLPHAFLAFLSACETAKGDKSQPDQTVHLAATMLFAGFKSVVGTMWSMNDMDGPVVAQKLYEELLSGDSEFLDPAAVPYALDASVQELRSKGLHPSRWAPYVHIGV